MRQWQERVQEIMHVREVLGRIMTLWMNRCLVVAFGTWADNVSERQRQSSILSNFLGHWANMGMASAFRTWVEEVALTNAFKRITYKVVSKWKNMCVVKALDTWRDWVKDRKRLQTSALRYVCVGERNIERKEKSRERKNGFTLDSLMLTLALVMPGSFASGRISPCRPSWTSGVAPPLRSLACALEQNRWHGNSNAPSCGTQLRHGEGPRMQETTYSLRERDMSEGCLHG